MDTLIETIEYNGGKIEVHIDRDPESPRDWDNLGVMACKHRRYRLGDKYDPLGILQLESVEEVEEKLFRSGALYLRLYLYDHSGIAMRSSRMSRDPFIGHAQHAGWDSGLVGWIYVTREDVRKEYGRKNVSPQLAEKALKRLEAEVEVYSDYIEGNVYGYMAEIDDEDAGSCWGFFGDSGRDQMIEEAKGEIDYKIKKIQKEKEKKLRAYIKNHVPLEKRVA